MENDNKVYNQEIKDDENERVVITKSGDIILITTYYKASGAITQETIEMVEQDDSIFAMSEVDALRKIVIDIITDESSYISINIIDTRQSHWLTWSGILDYKDKYYQIFIVETLQKHLKYIDIHVIME